KSQVFVDLHTSSLVKQLQFQNIGYDLEISRQKRELTSQLQALPPPFPGRLCSKLSQLMKRITSSNLSSVFRISAAKQALEIFDSINSPVLSKPSKVTKRGVAVTGSRSVETYLRVLELTVCEKHCPDELAFLIVEVCIRLVILFGLYSPESGDKESAASAPVNNGPAQANCSSVVLKISYVARMLRNLSCSSSTQYRAGMLSFISHILANCQPPVANSEDVNNDAHVLQVAATLISDLVILTDSLDQAGNVSRLARFISLVGDYNQSEFSQRFTDLADILIGWCVDSSSIHRGVAISSLLHELSFNLSRWWFDSSSSEDCYLLSESTCKMLGHLLEDADTCLQKAISEYRQTSVNIAPRRNAPAVRPLAFTEIAQNLIASNLYFAVLAGICSSVEKSRTAFPDRGCIKFSTLSIPDWLARVTNILHGLELISSVATCSSKFASTPRTYVPPSYSLPLLTYADILFHVHVVLLFTVSTMHFEGDYLRQKIGSCLSQPHDDSVFQPKTAHIQVLCELAYKLLEQTPSNSPGLVISTFKMIFGSESLLHRLKTSSSGSAEVFNLLCNLSKRHLSGCDMLAIITEMCIADFQFACTKLSGDSQLGDTENELLVLFSASLFVTILKPISDEPNRAPFANAANSRIILNLADLHRRFALCRRISQRVRLALWAILLSTLEYGVEETPECAMDLSFIIQQMFVTASVNLQELILSKRLLQSLTRPVAVQLFQPFCSYLLSLIKDPYSPVRAGDGSVFCDAIGLLIQLSANKTASPDVLELAALCANHPLPRIQSAGADLLIVSGISSFPLFESSRTVHLILQWFNSTIPDLSTSLLTSSSISAIGPGGSRSQNSNHLRTQGAFPSLPAAAGLLGLLTRGAPYISDERTSRLEILGNACDWLRRLTCLISPLPTDGRTNWYASDTSPLTIVVWFTTWSIVDYKLKVAPWANPVKTFLSIEAVVHALLSHLSKAPKYQPSTQELQGFLTSSTNAVSSQTLVRQIRQSTLAIQVLRQLEKTITNAVDGFTVALPTTPPAAHAFFKANAMTCYQWFNRVRTPLVSLASWIAPIEVGGTEASATTIWSVYSLLHQVTNSNPSQWFNLLTRFGNPETILLCAIQALQQVGAADELDLAHDYLKRFVPSPAKSTIHPFFWVHGLACLTRGHLDEGLSCLFTFLESCPYPSTDSVGAASREFVRCLLLATLLRLGNFEDAGRLCRLQLCDSVNNQNASAMCNNQGDTPPTKRKAVLQKAKQETSDDLPLRYPSVASEQLRALQKLASWDSDAISSISPSPSSAASIITEQEDKLLSTGLNSVSEVIHSIRHASNAVIPLADYTTYHDYYRHHHITPESSLPSLLFETDLLLHEPTHFPSVNDVGFGSWSLLTRKGGNLPVFLHVCEPLILTQCCDRIPSGFSKDIAMKLLRQQFGALGLSLNRENYRQLVDTINVMEEFSGVDRLRLVRYLGNLLWTSDTSSDRRVAAMNCLAQGLQRSVLETNASDRSLHAKQCLLNASVALQLFKFLESPVQSSIEEGKVKTLCEEVFSNCASDAGIGETSPRNAHCLVQHLLQFTRLTAAPWVDGVPLVPPGDKTGADVATFIKSSSPSELSMRLLMFATRLSPTNASAAAWLEMANWCYWRGQKEIKSTLTEAKRILALSQPDSISTTLLDSLTSEERDSLSQLLTTELPVTNAASGAQIVAKVYTFLSNDGEDGDSNFQMHQYCVDDLSDTGIPLNNVLRQRFASHLTTGQALPIDNVALDSRLLSGCANLASTLIPRLYTLYTFAAQAYVTYLAVAGQLINEGVSVLREDSVPIERIQPLEPTTATLRLLCLINEPCRSLRRTLKNLMVHGTSDDAPTLSPPPSLSSHSGPVVWAACLPQMLVRLGHPDPAVRQCLVELLCRLIRMTSPETSGTDRALASRLVFPVIVGSKGVDCVQLDARAKSHAEIVSTLCAAGCGDMVQQVSSFIEEMRRVAILWEELWSGALTQHVDELNKKISALEQDLKRNTVSSPSTPASCTSTSLVGEVGGESSDGETRMNSLCKLKYQALLTPTFTVLQQLSSLTLDVPAQTSHEAWFQRTFKSYIEETVSSLTKFCNSPTSVDQPTPVALLQQLISRLQTLSQPLHEAGGAAGRHPSSVAGRILHLAQISPRLAALNSNLSIPLPGRSYLNLARIGPKINVFPTKTRPKRIVFWGENGHSFPYLLKCLEDLRLDSRVMQLMRLTNIAFRSSGREGVTTTKTYSVTPIGPKAGLIQMVQGAVPLFNLYKRWQQRQAADANPHSADTEPSKLVLPKPSDLFYSKLREFMPPNVVHSSGARSSWPKDVLKKVFHSLQSETPADLLTRELWAASPNMSAWWRASQTFASSLGLTSAFGYLIGLGDRHLDNLLIDLSTGRLIHIDFNVCFDEGRSLRVPELVPFRLTRILRHPLGPFCDLPALTSGKGGTFGASFLETLKLCRSIRELFRVQLQSFEIDPLMDWMRAAAKGQQTWSTFDLTYLAAYRGGCLAGSADKLPPHKRELVTKKWRVHERMCAELHRAVGFLAARFVEVGGTSEAVCEQLFSVLNVLESNLGIWRTYREKQSDVGRYQQRLAILTTEVDKSEKLDNLEARIRARDRTKQELLQVEENLANFVASMETNIVSSLQLLARWLTPDSGVFNLPTGTDEDLQRAICDYRSVARAYIMPNDSPLHFLNKDTTWFSTKRQIISTTREMLDSFPSKKNLESTFSKLTFTLSHSSQDGKAVSRLQSALTEAEMHLASLTSQHFVPPTLAHENFSSLLSQNEVDLAAFISKFDGVMILPAFKWSLIKHVAAWIHSMYALEPLQHVDLLHHHTSVIACAFSPLDPSRNPAAMPFWAGQEADAHSELQFFLITHQFLSQVIELRNNLCDLLLPKLEDAIREASCTSVGLLDRIQQVVNGGSGIAAAQCAVNQILTENDGDPLSQVFLAIHLALLNSTAEMDELSRRMTEYPITAMNWVHADLVSQAIATLQSRCTATHGATSLWGWHPISGQSMATTWMDEVYGAGMSVVLKIAVDLRQLWVGVRDGKFQHGIPAVPVASILETDFITRLADRLALVSQSALACSRLLLSLLEESGFSVRQAVYEVERVIPHQRTPPTVFVDRMIQSADFYAVSVHPPEIQALSGMAGSMLTNIFARTMSYVHKTIAAREIRAAELQVGLIRDAKRVYSWLHDTQDESDGSLRKCLTRLETALSAVRKEGDQLDVETQELCELGEAICSAERDRLCESTCVNEILTLLADRKSIWQNYDHCEKELTPLDLDLLTMKDEYNLCWPAADWPIASVPGPEESNISLIDAVSERLSLAQEELSANAEFLKSLTLALVAKDATLATSSAKSRKKRRNNPAAATAAAQLHDEGLASVTTLRQALSSFQMTFLLEVRPHIKQLVRISQVYQDEVCVRIWSPWLDDLQAWTETANRIVQKFSTFLADLSEESKKNTGEDDVVCDLAEAILVDCQHLHTELTPRLLVGIRSGIWATLGRSESALIAPTLREVGFVSDEDSSDPLDQRPCSSSSDTIVGLLPPSEIVHREQIPPQAVAAMKRLCGRLEGVDDYLLATDAASDVAMSPAEQAAACVRTAVDPDRLAAMFEGWTPWV
uniref:Non-specific serine/threonine protein kinase n=1 Tax=Mesocestoides corti TaxID=53468 RepID=A0A5K3FKM1_MESCO